jgi:drug/metabolite transporter (DMT)-like permease
MVASEVAITVSIELLVRRADLSLGSILVYRSLLALVLLAIIVRPVRAEWLPRSPWVALLRVLTGGLTYVGWFGAIALLSGRVTQAVLPLDALILAYVRGQGQSYWPRRLRSAGELPEGKIRRSPMRDVSRLADLIQNDAESLRF